MRPGTTRSDSSAHTGSASPGSGPGEAGCFFENDPSLSVGRRALAEGVGTLVLMLVVSVSVTVAHLSRVAPGGGLLAVMVGPSATLAALIVALGAVSGGHFNPLITALQWLGGERSGLSTAAYAGAQLAGAVLGSVLGNGFGGASWFISATIGHWSWSPAELVGTAVLMLIVRGCARGGRGTTGPFAVGLWVAASSVVAPATLLNPALTLGALVASGPLRTGALAILSRVCAQTIGALIAFGIIQIAFGRPRNRTATQTPR
jgi:glycerol uptake facilitator-like aquaporin